VASLASGAPLLDPLAVGIAAWLLAAVFLRGAAHKLAGHAAFRATLEEYRLLPPALVPLVAVGLTVLEALLAGGLAWPAVRPPAAAGGAALLAVYGGAIAVNLRRGRVSIDCGCGGPGHGLSWLLVWRNVALVGLAAVAAAPPAARALGALDVGVLVAALATLWLLLLAVEQAGSNGAYVWLVRHERR
jgi:hypothetical protein